MKIGNAVVIFLNKFPYFHGMTMITVKSPVNKFNLLCIIIYKKLKFLFYNVNVPES